MAFRATLGLAVLFAAASARLPVWHPSRDYAPRLTRLRGGGDDHPKDLMAELQAATHNLKLQLADLNGGDDSSSEVGDVVGAETDESREFGGSNEEAEGGESIDDFFETGSEYEDAVKNTKNAADEATAQSTLRTEVVEHSIGSRVEKDSEEGMYDAINEENVDIAEEDGNLSGLKATDVELRAKTAAAQVLKLEKALELAAHHEADLLIELEASADAAAMAKNTAEEALRRRQDQLTAQKKINQETNAAHAAAVATLEEKIQQLEKSLATAQAQESAIHDTTVHMSDLQMELDSVRAAVANATALEVELRNKCNVSDTALAAALEASAADNANFEASTSRALSAEAQVLKLQEELAQLKASSESLKARLETAELVVSEAKITAEKEVSLIKEHLAESLAIEAAKMKNVTDAQSATIQSLEKKVREQEEALATAAAQEKALSESISALNERSGGAQARVKNLQASLEASLAASRAQELELEESLAALASNEMYRKISELEQELTFAQNNVTALTSKSLQLGELLDTVEAKAASEAEEAAAQIAELETKMVDRANAAALRVAALKKSMRAHEAQATSQITSLNSEVGKLKADLKEAISKVDEAKMAEESTLLSMTELQGELESARAEAIRAIGLQEELEQARGEFIKAQVVEAQVGELEYELEKTRIKALKGDVLETEIADLREQLRKSQAETAKMVAEVDKMRRGVVSALGGSQGAPQQHQGLSEIAVGSSVILRPPRLLRSAAVLRVFEDGSTGLKVLQAASLVSLLSKLQHVFLPLAAQVFRVAGWVPLIAISGTAVTSVSKRLRSSEVEPEIILPSGAEEL